MEDLVAHPSHYMKNSAVIEPIELTGRCPSPIAQALQYIIRRNDKGTLFLDLNKAIYWLEWYRDNWFDKEKHSLYTFDKVTGTYAWIFKDFTKDELLRQFLMALILEDNNNLVITRNSLNQAINVIQQAVDDISGAEPNIN